MEVDNITISYSNDNVKGKSKVPPSNVGKVLSKNNVVFLCHRCLYPFQRKSDVIRHVSKDNRCTSVYTCLLTDNEVSINSLRRYCFHDCTKVPELSETQKIHLIQNYKEDINIITTDLLKFDIHMSKKDSLMASCDSLHVIQDQPDSKKEQMKLLSITDDSNDMITILDKGSLLADDGKYECPYCKTVYATKSNLTRHIKKKKTCSIRSEMIKLSQHKAYMESISSKASFDSSRFNPTSTHSQGTTIYSNSNVTNIGTVNNILNQNNTFNQTCKVQLNDFFTDPYEFIHIANSAILQDKDFLQHKTFFMHIMSNNVNKNVFFEKGYGFVYTGGGITRITKEKAVYVILEKMRDALGSYLRTNSMIDPKDYEKIIRFYEVEVTKYLIDTVFKPFDVEKQEYLYSAAGYIFTRDVHIAYVTQILNSNKDETMEILKEIIKEIGVIDESFELNIPNFVSRRLRNKDLKDDY